MSRHFYFTTDGKGKKGKLLDGRNVSVSKVLTEKKDILNSCSKIIHGKVQGCFFSLLGPRTYKVRLF